MVSQSKAETYLRSLDEARCASDWAAVKSMIAKVGKLDTRKEFAHTASMEAELYELYTNDPLNVNENKIDQLTKLYNDFSKELGNSDPEEDYIHRVDYAHTAFFLQKYQQVVQLLQINDLSLSQQQISCKYTLSVAMKKRVLTGKAFEKLNQPLDALEVYNASAELKMDDSKEFLCWAELMYSNYANLACAQNADYNTYVLPAMVGYHRIVKFLLAKPATRKEVLRRMDQLWKHSQLMSEKIENRQDDDNSTSVDEIRNLNNLYEQLMWSQSKFPHADEPNDKIEQFAVVLTRNWETTTKFEGFFDEVVDRDDRAYTDRVLTSLRKAAAHTFHSEIIMRLQVFVLSSLGLYEEALKTFDIYKAYLQRLEVRKQSGGISEGEGDDRHLTIRTFSKALDICVYIKKDEKLAQEYADLAVKWMPGYNNEYESKIVAKSYYAIATAYVFLAEELPGENPYREMALMYYQKSLECNPNVAPVYFLYAVELARSGKITESLGKVREGLLHDGKSLVGWHLMALLLSVQEEYETAIKVVNTALELPLLSDHNKRCQIELKMTQIALIEASAGTEAALEKLPEVLGLYSELFPPNSSKSENETNGAALAPVKSRRSIFRHHSRRASTGTTNTAKPTTTTTTTATKSDKDIEMLQKVWLWVAGVYRRANQWTECEQAIVEAESWGATPESHTQLGLLISNERPIHASEEFEIALEKDKDHLGATLGLAQLILANMHKPDSHLFISEKDKLAAHARIVGLAETLSQRFPGSQTPECFWVLSQLYENNRRYKQAQIALWKAVQLEEIRPVRNYTCIHM